MVFYERFAEQGIVLSKRESALLMEKLCPACKVEVKEFKNSEDGIQYVYACCPECATVFALSERKK